MKTPFRNRLTTDMLYYPNYYKSFRCIGSKCRHNCCIGWEIDIDADTREYYRTVEGKLKKRLEDSISDEGCPHFILKRNERCPFLNRRNLCDIILTLGEDSLCDICREHPRYYNETSYGEEVGLGLCCEEAARLIFSQTGKITLISENGEGVPAPDDAWEEELLTARDFVLSILEDDSKSVSKTVELLYGLSSCREPQMADSISLLLSLEILSPDWKRLIEGALRYADQPIDPAFSSGSAEWRHVYRQFSVYLAYRYLIKAQDDNELHGYLALIAWSLRLFYHLSYAIFQRKKRLTFNMLVELGRLFSSELEYSEENLDAIVAMLRGN